MDVLSESIPLLLLYKHIEILAKHGCFVRVNSFSTPVCINTSKLSSLLLRNVKCRTASSKIYPTNFSQKTTYSNGIPHEAAGRLFDVSMCVHVP
eukprot:6201466-Pleurochrysis_carterae.AAC.5